MQHVSLGELQLQQHVCLLGHVHCPFKPELCLRSCYQAISPERRLLHIAQGDTASRTLSMAGEPAEPKRSSMASYEYDISTAQFTGNRLSRVWSGLCISPVTQLAYASKHGGHMHGRFSSKHPPDSLAYALAKQGICSRW